MVLGRPSRPCSHSNSCANTNISNMMQSKAPSTRPTRRPATFQSWLPRLPLLMIAALPYVATAESPSLEQMAKEERRWTLPCGLDRSLGVPSAADLKELRREAKEFQDNTNLRDAWMSLDARKTIRNYLKSHRLDCADAMTLRDAAVEKASVRVDDALPLQRKPRFTENFARALNEHPEQFRTTVVNMNQSTAEVPRTPPQPVCDTLTLVTAARVRDSLQGRADSINKILESPDTATTYERRLERVMVRQRLMMLSNDLQPSLRQAKDRFRLVGKDCPDHPLTREGGR